MSGYTQSPSLLEGYTDGIETKLDTLHSDAVVPVVLDSNTITRPADTSQYTSGDLVANNTSAGSVTPFSFAGAVKAAGGKVRIERVRIKTSQATLTNGSFRVWLYRSSPTAINGDNSAFSTAIAEAIGAFDITLDKLYSDGAGGSGVPLVGPAVLATVPSGTTLYALLEARAAYTPTSAQTFILVLEGYQF